MLFIIATILACDGPSEGVVTEMVLPVDTTKIIIDLRTIDFSQYGSSDTVIVRFDHSRKRVSKYLAHLLKPILHSWIHQYELDTASTQIVWVCKDDYRPSNSMAEVLSRSDGYLAFRDLDVIDDQLWPDSLAEGYAPYYLVWQDVPYDDHQLAWPYGLVKVELLRKDPYETLYPPDKNNLVRGFDKYRKHCQKCHPLNGIGGDMGPEFNRPKNITEYFDRVDIINYAKDPTSYRENSKMYAIRSLSDDDFEAVVDYLEWLTVRND